MGNAKKLTASACTIALIVSGCASHDLERKLSVAEDRQFDITMYTKKEVVAWDAEKISSGASREPSEEIKELVAKNCQHIFESGLIEIKNETFRVRGLDSDEPYAKAMLLAENVILDLENCASDSGAIAQFRLVSAKGSWYEIDDWVYRIDRYNKDRKRVSVELEEARKKEKTTAAVVGVLVLLGAAAAVANSSGGGYVNPNQHWVNGYFRQDGTYVPGHWRTNPNNVCWDNLNGCP